MLGGADVAGSLWTAGARQREVAKGAGTCRGVDRLPAKQEVSMPGVTGRQREGGAEQEVGKTPVEPPHMRIVVVRRRGTADSTGGPWPSER